MCGMVIRLEMQEYRLASAVSKNSCLKEFTLTKSPLAADGLSALGKMVENQTHLQVLNLTKLMMGDHESVVQFLGAISINSVFRKLDLSNNEIGDLGCIALAEALKLNSSIEYVNLHLNIISDRGSCALGGALVENKSL
jgi:Leucine-rich repeat (LRR) protein